MFLRSQHVRSLVIASCLGSLFLSSCASDSPVLDPYEGRQKREEAMQRDNAQQANPAVVRKDVLQPAMTAVNTRIAAYSDKLREWQDIERKSTTMVLPSEKRNRINECRANLEHILLEYNALQQQLQRETRVDAAQLLAGNSLLLLNQQDIEYLESGCGNYLTELQQQQQVPAAVAAADPQIKAAFDNADFDQVINLYAQMLQSTGQRPALETSYQYAQALVKNHQESEAARVVNDLVQAIRQQSGQNELLLSVLQLAADLAFTREAYDEARRLYEEVVKVSIEKGAHKEEWAGLQLAALQPGVPQPTELRDFGGLLKQYLAYVPKRDGFAVTEGGNRFLQHNPYTRLGANVNLLRTNARNEADAWLNRGLNRVETAVGERRVQDGQTSGDQVAAAAQGTVTPPPVEGAAVVPGTVSNVTPPALVVDEKSSQEDYDRGMAHFQAKEYDKAIERFNRLQHTAYEPKVQPMVTEASKQAAQEVRQKAAELFVRGSNSRDPEEKRKLLLSARDLLQSILTKYPQSGLTDKVQRNLARIESDLRGLESSSTPRPVSSGGANSGGAYVPPKTGGSSL